MTETPYLDAVAADRQVPLPNDTFYLAATIWAEARGEGTLGMRLVAHVIKNRVNDRRGRFGTGYQGVTTKPWQFSCWNRGDPNRAKLTLEYLNGPKNKGADRAAWLQAQRIAVEVIEGTMTDMTAGADHYHTTAVNPEWNRKRDDKGVLLMNRVSQVGNHVFYKAR